MANITQQLCDGCGELLTGKKGMEQVRKPFIQIKGSLGVGEVDKDTGWRNFLFLTPSRDRNNEIELQFCDLDCLGSYIENTSKIAKQKREESLRRQASEEQINRNAGGYEDPRKNFGIYS